MMHLSLTRSNKNIRHAYVSTDPSTRTRTRRQRDPPLLPAPGTDPFPLLSSIARTA
jgi:hypothetical protein